ncbi:EVE domain-containing protein [Subtercola lobariae]|nr:EVE domain-containing protein [Subtercola lobariae]
MSAWLGVVSRSHVERGVGLGIAQVNHGKMSGLTRMSGGDWIAYYSPRTDYPDGDPLKQFTAIGTIIDDDIYQADDGDFHPFRRRVDYLTLKRAVPLAEVTDRLDLTSGPNWGYQLRRGLIPLSDADFEVIRAAATD